jgi:hypothetical protein
VAYLIVVIVVSWSVLALWVGTLVGRASTLGTRSE